MFDPYHKWLGIPKNQRPPTLYQLLGIAPGEADPEVIDEAAIRQTAHVRTYQIGAHSEDCTKILNEIAQARATLLNPAKRKQYDATLAKKAAPGQRKAEEASADRPIFSPFSDLEDAAPRPKNSALKRKPERLPASTEEKTFLSKPVLYAIIGGVAGFAIVIVLLVIFAPNKDGKTGDSSTALDASAQLKPAPIATKPEPEPEPKATKKKNPDTERTDAQNKPSHDLKEQQPAIGQPPQKPAAPDPSVPKELPVNPPAKKPILAPEGPADFRQAKVRHFGGFVPVTNASLSPDGQSLLLAGPERDLVLVDVGTGKERKIASRAQQIHHAVFAQDGTSVVAAGRQPNDLLILFTLTGEVLWALDHKDKGVRWTFVSVAADGQQALVGASDNSVRTLRVDNVKRDGHFERFNTTDVPLYGGFSSDGRHLFGAGVDKVKVWIETFPVGTKSREHHAFPNCSAATISKSFDQVLFADKERRLLIAKRGGKPRLVGTHPAPVQAVAISTDENLAASADEQGRVSIWDLKEGQEVWGQTLQPAPGRRMEFAHSDRCVLLIGNGVDMVDGR
jgi:hypothetical protein